MLVVFSGIDGSGKTTQALLLNMSLKKIGIKSSYIHFTSLITIPIYNILRHKMFLYEKQTRSSHLYSLTHQSDNSIFSRFLRYLFAIIMLLDNLMLYFFCSKLPSMLSWTSTNQRVFIFDRYFYDTLASFLMKGMYDNFLTKLYLTLAPKPNIVFFLDVPSSLAFQRKSERHPLYYNRMRVIYLRLVNLLPGICVKVNSTKKCDDVQRYIFKKVTKMLRRTR